MTSQETKKAFFDFFKSKQHDYIHSAPIVLKDDPSLMFTNAGMNQFKSIFLGTETIDQKRVYNTQKCLRVSGKHNDLEEVGIDLYHHTMFEMMGNWSFGNYFKKEAITWAWELLTEVYKIDKSNLYVTVFEGAKEDKLSKDEEAYAIWKSIVDENQIILGNKKDNFWEMGEQGPCGPSSEIHIDLRTEAEKRKTPAQDVVNKDHPDVIEIWNLVFIEFNRKANGTLEHLPNKHIDTGMGFERLCRILQHKNSNYDTDIFQPLIQKIEHICGLTYGDESKNDIAFRVIADHIRAVAFCIVDGQLPSSNGAGYVIRRILRRAVRYAYTFLGIKEAFMYKLVDVLIAQFKSDYPEIEKYQSLCKKVIREEEHSFLNTLSQGLKRLDDIVSNSTTPFISGHKVFELFDTYGFPKDLTALILHEKELDFNQDEFNAALAEQKKRSKSASESTTGDWQNINYSAEGSFVGYDTLYSETRVLKYRSLESKKEGKLYQIVLDKTPFYPEGGGQVGDRGAISFDGEIIKVINTKKEHGDIVHLIKEFPKRIDGPVAAQVSKTKRFYSECNHSATHLLHFALRKVLGTHVEQKGSLVNDKHLRFDFSHFEKIPNDKLSEIETLVNYMISERIDLVEHRDSSFKAAKEEGAMALFGEKYGDKVRTIRFGNSIELCGGTHVKNTGDIWHFKILNESSIASGIRRIEAITNVKAKEYFETIVQQFQDIQEALGTHQNPVPQLKQLQQQHEQLQLENEKLLKAKAQDIKSRLLTNVVDKNGINVIAEQVDLDAKSMKDISFQLAGEIENLFLVLGAHHNGKALMCCYISKDLVEAKDLHAGSIIKQIGQHIKGGGGGQAFFATAGGKNPNGIQDALQEATALIS